MSFDFGLYVFEITPVLWGWEVREIFPEYRGQTWLPIVQRGTASTQRLATEAGEKWIDARTGRSV